MSRRGFTLLELMVALGVAGLVVLVAEHLFAGTIDTSRAIADSRRALDHEMNARRLLSSAFGSIEVGPQGAEFNGQPGSARFVTWLQSPDGWFERRPVMFSLERGRVVLRAPGSPPVTIADDVTSLDLDYLLEPGAESHWVREWISPVSAPLAVRVRISGMAGPEMWADTVTYLVKARG